MARRRKQSPFEDLIDLAALMPWWITVPLALIAYLWLNSIVTSPIPAPANSADLGSHMSGMMLRGLAVPAQYLVPAALVFGAIASIFGRMRRKKLFDFVASNENTLESISWREFELLVGEAFRRKGFTVQETGQGGADGGIDLVLLKDGEKYLVQCKQWRRQLVQVNVIRELFGVMTAEGAKGGFVVISGRFSEDAKAFAQGKNLQLIEGAELNDMIRQSRAASARQQPYPTTSQTSGSAQSCSDVTLGQSNQAIQPTCPTCQAVMVSAKLNAEATLAAHFGGARAFQHAKASEHSKDDGILCCA